MRVCACLCVRVLCCVLVCVHPVHMTCCVVCLCVHPVPPPALKHSARLLPPKPEIRNGAPPHEQPFVRPMPSASCRRSRLPPPRQSAHGHRDWRHGWAVTVTAGGRRLGIKARPGGASEMQASRTDPRGQCYKGVLS